MKLYDLSFSLAEDFLVYPGDPKFLIKKIKSLEKGDGYNLSQVTFGNHTGTHIDFPAHVFPGGKTSSDFPIELFMGIAQIVEVPEKSGFISEAFISNVLKNFTSDFLFFKTKTNRLACQENVYVHPKAGELLKKSQVRIVGIDSLSVDPYHDSDLTVHHLLLGSEILILENLNLEVVSEGRYKVIIAPLNIPALDGLPVRVIAEVII